MTPRRALVLDSSGRYRLRVAAVLDEHPAIHVVGAVETIDDALRRARRQPPDLIVLDVDFSGETGIQAIQRLLIALPEVALWVLTDQGTARGPRARAAFKLGVQAWLEKPASGVDALRGTLHAAAETLLAGSTAGPKNTDKDERPRRAVLPALKTMPREGVRVRPSTPAPPAEPMPRVARPRLRRPRRQTPAQQPLTVQGQPHGPTEQGRTAPAPETPQTAPATATAPMPPVPTAPLLPRRPAAAAPSAPARRPATRSARRAAVAAPAPAPPDPPTLVVFGASTGGPEALALLLAELPEDLSIPVVVVQDMPTFFLQRFAERLHAQGPLPTALAVQDGPLLPGRVWLAPGDKHLEIRGGPGAYRAALHGGRRLHGCRPAVDATLISLARPGAGAAQVVILTGMGRDGADGAKALLQHGAHVIAQDKATSLVWGMPGAVADEGTAHTVLPISEISPVLHSRLPPRVGGQT